MKWYIDMMRGIAQGVAIQVDAIRTRIEQDWEKTFADWEASKKLSRKAKKKARKDILVRRELAKKASEILSP